MTEPLHIVGWFRICHPSGVKSAVEKVIYVDDWNNKIVQMLLRDQYEFRPVHVFTDEELADYVKDKLLSS